MADMSKYLILLLLFVTPGLAWPQPSPGLVDPLRPSRYRSQPPADVQLSTQQIDTLRQQFQLTAILKSADRAMAVINGRPLQVGQTIGPFRLSEIGGDYVVLHKGEQKLTLYRTISGVKKSPAQKQ